MKKKNIYLVAMTSHISVLAASPAQAASVANSIARDISDIELPQAVSVKPILSVADLGEGITLNSVPWVGDGLGAYQTVGEFLSEMEPQNDTVVCQLPVIESYRKVSMKPSQYRLANLGGGLVLQGFFDWEDRKGGAVTHGADWISIPTVIPHQEPSEGVNHDQ